MSYKSVNRPIRISDEMVMLAYATMNGRREAGDCSFAADDLLKKMTKKPMRVIWRAMERAYNRGYIEFGVSMRTGWPTKEGWALLDAAMKEEAERRELAHSD